MSTAHLKKGRWRRSLKTSGELIWYGTLAMQRSKNGRSVFKQSPIRIWSLACIGVPWTRFCNSATNRGSISQAITFLHFSRILTVIFPVPGPISRTTSVGRRADFSSMLVITSGFFRMCWPKSLLKTIPKIWIFVLLLFSQDSNFNLLSRLAHLVWPLPGGSWSSFQL